MHVKHLLLATLLTVGLSLHATNGLLQIGYGAKSKAMGGVGVALPQDAFASALNPAGMSLLGDRFDVGLHWLHQHAKFSTTGGLHPQAGCSGQNLWWPEVGFNRLVCRNQSVGAAVFVGGEWETYYKNLTPDADSPVPTLSHFQFVSITPSWSWQINTCHSLGIAVNAVVAKLRVDGPQITNSVAPAFTTDRGNDYQWGIGARFGWLGQFSHCVQVGATYQTRTYLSHFRKYRGLIPEGGDADLPAQFGVGVAWQLFRGVVVSADAVKIFWREGRLFRNDYDEDSGPFGSRSGPALGWDEQMVFKGGLSWDVLECLTLRIGYNHGNCPIPRGNLLDVQSADTVQDHATIGFTWEWRCHQVSFVYLHAFTNTIKGFEPLDRGSFLILKGRQDSVGIEYGYLF
ncbi:MAG: OmpP1/FadL family transporter [Parachlamydiales bacterium]